MQNFDLENIKSHPSLSLAKAKASRDLQINFNQAEDPLTISTKSRGDNKCGSATHSGRSLLPECGADAPTVLSAVYTDSTPAKNRQADVPQYGRSMIEMLGVLAIIGVLSVGGIAGYSKAMHKYRINKTIEQITLIAGNVRAFFGPQKNYLGMNCDGSTCNTKGCYGHSGVGSNGSPTSTTNGCPIIKKAKILPDEMITVTDGKIMSITNLFGYWVSLYTANKAKSGDNQAFTLTYAVDGSNLDVCLELASHDWSVAGVKGISAFDPGPLKGGNMTVPGDMDKAFDVCSKAYSNGARYIALVFYFDVNSNCWNETSGNTCS